MRAIHINSVLNIYLAKSAAPIDSRVVGNFFYDVLYSCYWITGILAINYIYMFFARTIYKYDKLRSDEKTADKAGSLTFISAFSSIAKRFCQSLISIVLIFFLFNTSLAQGGALTLYSIFFLTKCYNIYSLCALSLNEMSRSKKYAYVYNIAKNILTALLTIFAIIMTLRGDVKIPYSVYNML
ncbi:hypothetical protein NEFER03_1436 [Nematocida sp. LUAm3]|nr:hypothetical protein NEFER03_1436 [Nematocida sp. LUAm3]KAI5174734.1 hypothetical protein NEFER02_0844 [Nematocida sp. LUAm2]KAI5177855.1 hypothetical protein NEFER01_1057 [Nematocida sp. LUAm1]